MFKTTSDPFVGKLSFVRVYSGKIAHEIYNGTKDVSEKVGGLFHMIGKKQEPADEGIAGDILVISKLVQTATNDTISTRDTASRACAHRVLAAPAHAFSQTEDEG